MTVDTDKGNEKTILETKHILVILKPIAKRIHINKNTTAINDKKKKIKAGR